MGKWQPFPIVGGAYTDDALPWTAQDTVNYLPVRAERAGGRSQDKLEQVPGMVTFTNVGTGPHRGGRDVEGKMFVVSGNKLYQVSTLGVATELGTIPGTGLVSMTHNQITGGNELVIGNGSSGYVYNTKTSVFSQIGDVDFPGFVTVDFINQYIVGVEPQRRFWFHSDLAAATDYGSLDQYEAESAPDRLVGGIASHSEYVAFGERTIEFFRNDPTSSSAFQRIDGVTAERGCANHNTIKRLDNSVFFLADNGTVCKLENGYTPVPVSTRALEAEIAKRDWTKAFAFTWEDRGHAVYYLTFQDGRTFGWDVAQGEWSRRESYGLTRWRLNTLFKWNGDWYGGDYNSGKLFRLDWDYALDGCDPLERRRITGVTHNHQNRMFVSGLEVVMDTGNVESGIHAAATISGALPDSNIGEAVSYQYPITRAYQGQVVAVSILSGALPTGLSISAGGLVTGTRTAEGTFTWTLRITDDCGQTIDLPDSATYTDPWSFFIIQDSVYNGGVYTTDDPTTWGTSRNASLGTTATAVFGLNKKVFLWGVSGVGKVSSDFGVTWTSLTGVTNADTPHGMTYAVNAGVGRYILACNVGGAAGNKLFVSTDGLAFSEVTVAARTYYNAATIGATAIVMSTIGDMIRSTDGGATWSAIYSTGIGTLPLTCTTPTAFLATGKTSRVIGRSTTGAASSWTSVYTTPEDSCGIAAGGGYAVWLGVNGQTAYSSNDGVSWTAGPTLSGILASGFNPNITYGGGLFVAVGGLQRIYTSPTGAVWTQRQAIGSPPQFDGIAAMRRN